MLVAYDAFRLVTDFVRALARDIGRLERRLTGCVKYAHANLIEHTYSINYIIVRVQNARDANSAHYWDHSSRKFIAKKL